MPNPEIIIIGSLSKDCQQKCAETVQNEIARQTQLLAEVMATSSPDFLPMVDGIETTTVNVSITCPGAKKGFLGLGRICQAQIECSLTKQTVNPNFAEDKPST